MPNPKPKVASSKQITKSMVRQMINSTLTKIQEVKVSDKGDSGSAASIDWIGFTPVDLTNIAQGDTDATRDGDTIILKSVEWSMLYKYNNSSTLGDLKGSGNVVRFILFRWHPLSSDVSPTLAKIIQYTAVSYAPHAPLNHDGRDQFDILIDKVIVLDGFSKAFVNFKGLQKLDSKLQFKASTTDGSGKLYFTCLSDAVSGTGPYPTLESYLIRVSYTDS